MPYDFLESLFGAPAEGEAPKAMTKEANLSDMRAKIAKDAGVSEALLSAETEEACMAQA